MTRITIFNEFLHERQDEQVKALYPDGIHAALEQGIREAAGSQADGIEFRTALQDDPEHGLGGDVLERTDTLIW